MSAVLMLATFNTLPVNSFVACWISAISCSISMLLGAPPLRRVVVEAIEEKIPYDRLVGMYVGRM